jgi:hypothetical protein
VASPEVKEDRVEDAENEEAPLQAVDNDLLALGGELVDHGKEQEEVNQ